MLSHTTEAQSQNHCNFDNFSSVYSFMASFKKRIPDIALNFVLLDLFPLTIFKDRIEYWNNKSNLVVYNDSGFYHKVIMPLYKQVL